MKAEHLRKLISGVPDDFDVEIHISIPIPESELKNMIYPYPYTEIRCDTDEHSYDISFSDKKFALLITLKEEEE